MSDAHRPLDEAAFRKMFFALLTHPRPGQFRGNPDGIAGDVMPTPHKEQRA